MSLVAPVQNGEIIETSTVSSTASKTNEAGNNMSKDSFLQLLVAQMKYQDPLEPTSNTEYISQYAQFSELEEMQNLSGSMDLQRASALVGKSVIMKSTDSSGDTNYIQGRVDYVINENSKVYLSINDKKYDLDDLDTVVDEDYLNAINLVADFEKSLKNLPNIEGLTTEYKDVITNLEQVYNDMNAYQKNYLTKDDVAKYQEYVAKMKELTDVEAAKERTEANSSAETDADEDEATI